MNNNNIGENPSTTATSKKVRIFACEKPHSLKHISSSLNKSGELGENDFFIITPSTASFKFSYPKIIGLKDAPYVNLNPEYKCLFAEYGQYGKVYDRNGKLVDNELSEILNEYHSIKSKNYVFKDSLRKSKERYCNYLENNVLEIINFCDHGHTGARGFKFHFEKYHGLLSLERLKAIYDVKVSVVRCLAYDEKTVIKSYKSRFDYSDESSIFMIDYFRKKDFLDYNFNINSMLYLGNTLRHSGIYLNDFINRNMLYTLLIIDEMEKATEPSVIEIMEKNNIGSCASRATIIEKLYDYEFVELIKTGVNHKKSYIRLSDCAKLFLSNLHPSLKSYKVASKFYKKTGELSLKEFKVEVSKYLNNVFEKQDRFLASK